MWAKEEQVKTRYGEARVVLFVYELFAGLLLVVGGIWFLTSIGSVWGAMTDHTNMYQGSEASEQGGFEAMRILGLGPSFLTMMAGFFSLAQAQITKASLDSADCARESLFLARRQAEGDPPS